MFLLERFDLFSFIFFFYSNFQRDVLLGRDELVEFSDFLATEDMHEVMRQPHAVVERSLGIY